MDPVQLHLFEPHKPLAARLGSEFFSAAPPEPGVYVMTDSNERVIYIGQSGNLRARLGSYKNARLDRATRKTVRLVHNVARIAYETCPTVEAARVREAELLRVHRPRFNRVGTYPRAYIYLNLKTSSEGVQLIRSNDFDPSVEQYGAFKTMALPGYTALLRTLWFLQHGHVDPNLLPHQLIREKPPRSFLFTKQNLLAELRNFLQGLPNNLIESSNQQLSQSSLTPFESAFHTDRLNTLEGFFQSGPRRNLLLREKFSLESLVLSQEQLDDILAASRRRPPA